MHQRNQKCFTKYLKKHKIIIIKINRFDHKNDKIHTKYKNSLCTAFKHLNGNVSEQPHGVRPELFTVNHNKAASTQQLNKKILLSALVIEQSNDNNVIVKLDTTSCNDVTSCVNTVNQNVRYCRSGRQYLRHNNTF